VPRLICPAVTCASAAPPSPLYSRGVTPQHELGEVTHAPKVSPEESRLNFADPGVDARTHHNKVRGFAGWPGTKVGR
jgi:methionyl-tRNA formyltransferase